jgi:hypothetical protein
MGALLHIAQILTSQSKRCAQLLVLLLSRDLSKQCPGHTQEQVTTSRSNLH